MPRYEAIYGNLGRRIKERREALGMSQEVLSVSLGQTRASIANIEAGRQRVMLHDVPALARALGWTARQLMAW